MGREKPAVGVNVSLSRRRGSRAIPAARAAGRSARGRKPVISRDDLVEAALALVGPHRSVSTLSLREVAREAGIAPNSFYRQFRDMDELAAALIDRAGTSLRKIIGEARQRAPRESSVVRASVETFMAQLRSNDKLLHILLREGTVGSPAFKAAVDRQLRFFEDELQQDLVRIAESKGSSLHQPGTTVKAVTRLVFAMGASIVDLPRERDAEVTEELVTMVRMILQGSQVLGSRDGTEHPIARTASGRSPRGSRGAPRRPRNP
jgi:AcrR family transcriptional regulator